MSSKGSKKNAVASKNAIVTRTKSAQNSRQLRAKKKKTEKPVTPKSPNTKPEIKSTKVTKSDDCKDTPLKNKVMQLVQLVEQAEYYPDKLKRDLSIKKILLKPKHNFKVVAAANKRKLGTPRREGGTPPTPLKKRRASKAASHSEMSMADMIRLIEDTHTLSDEDFMEILTCPSPVWWEDPPDDRYTEDAICKRAPSQSSPISVSTDDNSKTDEQNDKQTNTTSDKTKKKTNNKDGTLVDFENEIEKFKITTQTNITDDKIINKKRKLENILGNIKNVKNNNKNKVANKNEIKNNEVKKTDALKNNEETTKIRTASTSTDGEDLSDLCFNDEEVLKNLENIRIPIEQTKEQKSDNKIEINIIGSEPVKQRVIRKKFVPVPVKKEPSMPRITVKKFATCRSNNELIVPDKMPPLTRKPEIKNEKSEKPDSNPDYLDNVSHLKFRFITDDDVSLIEGNGEDKVKNSLGESSSLEVDPRDSKKDECEIKMELIENETTNATANIVKNSSNKKKKVANDLSEYITVYKIMSHENEKNGVETDKINKSPENSSNNNVTGKLNNFFKKRKSNKRVKKSDSSFPANTNVKEVETVGSDVKNSVENSENRLKPCDNCVVKTENGATVFACDLCNFRADTKEVYTNHITSCKDSAHVPWNHNFITNQT